MCIEHRNKNETNLSKIRPIFFQFLIKYQVSNIRRLYKNTSKEKRKNKMAKYG